MAERITLLNHPNAQAAARHLITRSALFGWVELVGDGTSALLHSPAPSSGEKLLWQALSSLAGTGKCNVFEVYHGLDEDNQRAFDEALRIVFGGKVEDVSAA